MGKDKTDRITDHVQQQKAAAQLREQHNLLYVALTRARQYLYISGVEAGRSASGWYPLMLNAISTLAPDAENQLIYSYGAQKIGAVSALSCHDEHDQVEGVAALQQPVKQLPATEYMIAPSRVNLHNPADYSSQNTMDAEHGQARGIAIHRALDLLSRQPPYTLEAVKQQLVAETGMNTGDADLNDWLEEASAIVSNDLFREIFRPERSSQTHNELPLLFESDSRPVYGLVDRLVVGEKDILLIDYKTHVQAKEETIAELTENFRAQISLYTQGVQQIWPGHNIRQGLLFTARPEIVWL